MLQQQARDAGTMWSGEEGAEPGKLQRERSLLLALGALRPGFLTWHRLCFPLPGSGASNLGCALQCSCSLGSPEGIAPGLLMPAALREGLSPCKHLQAEWGSSEWMLCSKCSNSSHPAWFQQLLYCGACCSTPLQETESARAWFPVNSCCTAGSMENRELYRNNSHRLNSLSLTLLSFTEHSQESSYGHLGIPQESSPALPWELSLPASGMVLVPYFAKTLIPDPSKFAVLRNWAPQEWKKREINTEKWIRLEWSERLMQLHMSKRHGTALKK